MESKLRELKGKVLKIGIGKYGIVPFILKIWGKDLPFFTTGWRIPIVGEIVIIEFEGYAMDGQLGWMQRIRIVKVVS